MLKKYRKMSVMVFALSMVFVCHAAEEQKDENWYLAKMAHGTSEEFRSLSENAQRTTKTIALERAISKSLNSSNLTSQRRALLLARGNALFACDMLNLLERTDDYAIKELCLNVMQDIRSPEIAKRLKGYLSREKHPILRGDVFRGIALADADSFDYFATMYLNFKNVEDRVHCVSSIGLYPDTRARDFLLRLVDTEKNNAIVRIALANYGLLSVYRGAWDRSFRKNIIFLEREMMSFATPVKGKELSEKECAEIEKNFIILVKKVDPEMRGQMISVLKTMATQAAYEELKEIAEKEKPEISNMAKKAISDLLEGK